GFLHRNEVFDGHGVQYLATKALGNDTGANPLTRCVDCSRSASRATTDDQNIEDVFGAEFFGLARSGRGIQFGENFFNAGTTLTEDCAVHEYRGHSHDLACFNFLLE